MRPASELVDGAWRARWGHYAVFLVKRADAWHGALCHVDSTSKRWDVFESPDAGAQWASRLLERQGCLAFVDGQRQELAKFLAFEQVDVAEVVFIP